MDCPYCSHNLSKVTNKRESPQGIRRRRECLKCGKRYTTYEKVEKVDLFIIKKDGKREKFDIEKLEKGIQKAFEKRPVSQEEIDKIIHEIEEKIRKKGTKEVKSDFVGELVIKKLKKTDKVAYIRFASVYKDFQDIEDFESAIKEI